MTEPTQLDLVPDETQAIPDDGKTDLQRLMDKKAEDLSQRDVSEICKILRERRNQYNLEELEKASKPKKEPKPKAAPKPKSATDKAAAAITANVAQADLDDILGDLLE